MANNSKDLGMDMDFGMKSFFPNFQKLSNKQSDSQAERSNAKNSVTNEIERAKVKVVNSDATASSDSEQDDKESSNNKNISQSAKPINSSSSSSISSSENNISNSSDENNQSSVSSVQSTNDNSDSSSNQTSNISSVNSSDDSKSQSINSSSSNKDSSSNSSSSNPLSESNAVNMDIVARAKKLAEESNEHSNELQNELTNDKLSTLSNTSSSDVNADSTASDNSEVKPSSTSSSSVKQSEESNQNSISDTSEEDKTSKLNKNMIKRASANSSSTSAQKQANNALNDIINKNNSSKASSGKEVTNSNNHNNKSNKKINYKNNFPTKQEILHMHAMPAEAMQVMNNSVEALINKAQIEHEDVNALLTKSLESGNMLSKDEITMLINANNKSFNNLKGSINNINKQTDFRLGMIERNLQNTKDKALKGEHQIKIWKDNGIFSNVSKNLDLLAKVVNDPGVQEFVKSRDKSSNIDVPKNLKKEFGIAKKKRMVNDNKTSKDKNKSDDD